MMGRDTYLRTLQTNKTISGLLPIFNTTGNTLSIARQFQLKTTLSTKLASMIAISAQAATGSINATDHSDLSYLNQYYQDRYKKHIQDPSNGASGTNTSTTGSNDQKIAQLFSDHISGIYANIDNFDVSKIEMAKNYYIERMSKVKSGDPITTAAPFIPADLEITVDGISGIIMGNAFTIPENRLPLSLRGDDGFTKVGFIVTGLTHTVNENEWLTRIKGQMIKLRTHLDYGAVQQITSTQAIPATVTPNYKGLTGSAVDDAVNFIKQQEGLASTRKLDTSIKNTAIPYASSTVNPNSIVYPYNLEGNKNSDGTPALTIGWGTYGTYKKGIREGKFISANDVITVQEAEANLRAEVGRLYTQLANKASTDNVALTNGQTVALLDLGYNAGSPTDNPLYTSLVNRTQPKLQDVLNYKTSTFSASLRDRRQKEYNLFIS